MTYIIVLVYTLCIGALWYWVGFNRGKIQGAIDAYRDVTNILDEIRSKFNHENQEEI